MSATPANDAQTPSAWNCGAKVVNYFGLGKKIATFFAIFSLVDAP